MANAVAVDTNTLIYALMATNDHFELALSEAMTATHVLGIVALETWSVLRRRAGLDAGTVSSMIDAHLDGRTLVGTRTEDYQRVLRTGRSLNLAGNVHDATILEVAAAHDLTIVTFDRGMARLGAGRVPVRLLPDEDPAS